MKKSFRPTKNTQEYLQLFKLHLKDPLYRNSYFLMANTVVTSSFGFFFWIIIARFYTEADVGLGTAIISAMGLLVTLSKLGFDFAFIRFLSKSEKPTELLNSGLSITGLTSLVVALIFVIGVDIWSPTLSFIKDNLVFTAAFIAFSLFLTLSSILDFAFIAKRRAGFVLFKNTAISILKIVLPFILVLFFRSFGIVSSLGIATGLVTIAFLLLFLPKIQNSYRPAVKINVKIVRDVWQYSVGNYFASLLAAAPMLILPIMIVNRLGAEENAYFYVAWMITSLLFIIPGAIAQSLFAEGSHNEDDLEHNVRRSYKVIYLLIIPAIIVLLCVGKWLLLAFGAGYSENGVALLRILVSSGIFIGLNSVYYTMLRVRSRIRELILLTGFIALAVLVGSYLITPKIGIIGVGYTWIAAQGIVSIYILCNMKLRHKPSVTRN